MRVGLAGLGRMGFNLCLNIISHGHEVAAFNRSPDKVRQAEGQGALGAYTLGELAAKLPPRRVVWLMVPAGQPTEDMLLELSQVLEPGDMIIDGGNSFYKDTVRRQSQLADKGVHLVDVGTSGGIEGARYGICAMVGAEPEDFYFLEPLLRDISVENGYARCGPAGSGHFVKMVHNGIEYGMMQALGEGFELLSAGPFTLDMGAVARVWTHGSVIRGWLMELLAEALAEDARLDRVRGVVHSSGEGLWTAQAALELGVPAPVIAGSVFMRYRSEQEESFAGKVAAALRYKFGGHRMEMTGSAPAEGSEHGA